MTFSLWTRTIKQCHFNLNPFSLPGRWDLNGNSNVSISALKCNNKQQNVYFLFFSNETADLVADALEFMYTPWPDNSDKYALRSQLVDLIGDYVFVAPSYEVADIHSRAASVYMYEFAHRSQNASFYSEWMGVAHGENLPYDFGIPLLPRFPEYDAQDKNISLFVMQLYVNFVKFGDPTPQPVSGIAWQKYNTSHRAYLRIDANPKMAAAFAPRRMAFWNDYYPKLTQVNFDHQKKVVVANGASADDTGVALTMFLQIVHLVVLSVF